MSGTSAEQFALLGAVFLILGASFVFAPQIVSAVNTFLAAVFRRSRKSPHTPPTTSQPARAAEPRPVAPAAPSLAEEYGPPGDQAVWSEEPEPEPASSAVARLRQEINSSWSSGGER